MEEIIWAIRGEDIGYKAYPNIVITKATDRESAKRIARQFLFGNPDNYVCEPISNPGDIVLVHTPITA